MKERFLFASLMLFVCSQLFSQNFNQEAARMGYEAGKALGEALFGGGKKSNSSSSNYGSSYSSSSSVAFYVEASKGTSVSYANVIVLNLNAAGGLVLLTEEMNGEGYMVSTVKEKIMSNPNYFENLASRMCPNANDNYSKLLVYQSSQNGYNFYSRHINTMTFWHGGSSANLWYYALSTDKKTFVASPTSNAPKYYVRVDKSEFELRF